MNRQFWLLIAITIALIVAVVLPLHLFDRAAKEKDTERAIKSDCEIVVKTAGIFSDYVQQEIQLRGERAVYGHVAPDVKKFDKAEVRYWSTVTLPALENFLDAECTKEGATFPIIKRPERP